MIEAMECERFLTICLILLTQYQNVSDITYRQSCLVLHADMQQNVKLLCYKSFQLPLKATTQYTYTTPHVVQWNKCLALIIPNYARYCTSTVKVKESIPFSEEYCF